MCWFYLIHHKGSVGAPVMEESARRTPHLQGLPFPVFSKIKVGTPTSEPTTNETCSAVYSSVIFIGLTRLIIMSSPQSFNVSSLKELSSSFDCSRHMSFSRLLGYISSSRYNSSDSTTALITHTLLRGRGHDVTSSALHPSPTRASRTPLLRRARLMPHHWRR